MPIILRDIPPHELHKAYNLACLSSENMQRSQHRSLYELYNETRTAADLMAFLAGTVTLNGGITKHDLMGVCYSIVTELVTQFNDSNFIIHTALYDYALREVQQALQIQQAHSNLNVVALTLFRIKTSQPYKMDQYLTEAVWRVVDLAVMVYGTQDRLFPQINVVDDAYSLIDAAVHLIDVMPILKNLIQVVPTPPEVD